MLWFVLCEWEEVTMEGKVKQHDDTTCQHHATEDGEQLHLLMADILPRTTVTQVCKPSRDCLSVQLCARVCSCEPVSTCSIVDTDLWGRAWLSEWSRPCGETRTRLVKCRWGLKWGHT